MIIDFQEHQHVSGQFLLGSVSKGTNTMGAPYLNLELRDSSGSINGKKWDVLPEDENIIIPGNVVYIEGDVLKYKENLQIKVLTLKLVPIEEVDATRFIKLPPVPKEELINRFNKYVNSIHNEDCQKLLHYFIDKYQDKLFVYPAGVSVHHEYMCGLLMHVTTMLNIAESLVPLYPDIDRDLLLTGIILHDIGKTQELEGPIVYKYSLEGKLLGHISIMVSEIKEAADILKIDSEVPLLLEHMVLSHHNEPEFGSPVPPLIKEAFLLTMIDNLDSKMVVVSKALETVEEGEFTQRIFPLDNRMLYKHKKVK